MTHNQLDRDAGSRLGRNIIDRLTRLVILLTVLIIAAAAAPKISRAQLDTLIYLGPGAPAIPRDYFCSPYDDCCDSFKFIINDTTIYMDLVLIPSDSTGGDSCVDHECWETQTRTTDTFDHPSQFVYRIRFTPANQARTGPFPDTVYLRICSGNNCMSEFPQYSWSTYQDSGEYPRSAHGTGYFTLCNHDLFQPCSELGPGCDYIQQMDDDSCDEYFCFHHPTGGLITSFTINFNPPITGCKHCHYGGIFGGQVDTVHVDQPGYSVDYSDSVHGNLTINGLVDVCGIVCFSVPKCTDNEIPRVITVTAPDGCPAYTVITMKKANGKSAQSFADSSLQNYPNPLDASTGFRTTVPFGTGGAGEATITITDQKGVKVSTESEDILGAGQHFFYFSAQDLPSGIYYYTIEFPQGVVITNKTMLVVK